MLQKCINVLVPLSTLSVIVSAVWSIDIRYSFSLLGLALALIIYRVMEAN